MRTVLPLTLLLATAPAAADTFGGFSGVDTPYLVNRDRICYPLSVKDGAATGAPNCEKDVTADVIAKLSIKDPIAQRGPKATFAATASGKTLTVTKKASGETVVTWSAIDPIGKVVEVYASQYEDRIAVAYTTRQLGKEVTNVVAFEVVKTTGREKPSTSPTTPTMPTTQTPTTPTTPAPPADPKLTKAVETARKAAKGKALAAWQAVLAIDAQHSEAEYRIAALRAGAKQNAEAIDALQTLAKSTREDAIEWLVEARFDKAFTALRSDAKFRAAVGLDRKAQTPYERIMGFGGQWEQTGTPCDVPEVKMTVNRDRTFKLRVKTICRGQGFEQPFKGTWRVDQDGIILTLPTKGKQSTVKDEAPCVFEKQKDEDALRCTLDRDLEFLVLPTRR
ncbi:MAG TPA: hypothetical protein VFV99_19200 [Kofleriaceae bacterium]|nr:hypothetical protein [Kofleriaceae bacterium]